ncbi:MAG: C69 family dipeptidase [Firmicutes bacterium]|nr:C69 family dipeptidase [Bacillota bacterium]
MACTTILVGKKASYDGSTMIARNDDGHYDVKKLVVVDPKKQPKKYKSVISHVEVELPDEALSYTCCPNVDEKDGIWAAAGINSANVSMTATETITSNARVLGADPLVRYQKASSKKEKDVMGGIGEEDLVVLVLPYIRSAKEGVIRLGQLLEKYGTYESNGIAFSDENEIWWLETIGGHHWIAARVKDEEYVIMPNQFGLDHFDLEDALSTQKEYMCSKDLKEFIDKYHLDCNNDGKFNPRLIFGSHDDQDHVYNTCRAWYMARYFNPRTYKWDGEDADFTPESDDIPWSLVPERKITVEEVKYILSSYYQGTKYNPYSAVAGKTAGMYRTIGIARTGFMSINQIRPYVNSEIKAVEWICFGPNPFNSVLPFYTNTLKMPKYVSGTTLEVSTDSFYWNSRLIGALTDPCYAANIQNVERYQKMIAATSTAILNEYDAKMMEKNDYSLIDEANQKIADNAKAIVSDTLNKVLYVASTQMKCNFNRADN